jgi:hypothetical protein
LAALLQRKLPARGPLAAAVVWENVSVVAMNVMASSPVAESNAAPKPAIYPLL